MGPADLVLDKFNAVRIQLKPLQERQDIIPGSAPAIHKAPARTAQMPPDQIQSFFEGQRLGGVTAGHSYVLIG